MNIYCSRIVDSVICGSNDAVQVTKDGFLACEPCRIEISNRQLVKSDHAVVNHGITTNIYILETPYGTLKIGRASNVGRRLKELDRDFKGAVNLLACFPGTHFDESELHIRFNEFRLMDRLGEQFRDVEVIREYAADRGISDDAYFGMMEYSFYQPTGTAKFDTDYLPPELRTDELVSSASELVLSR